MSSTFHLSIIGNDDEWETPIKDYNAACKKYGHNPSLDVCAREHSAKCFHYYGLDHKDPSKRNALDIPWTEDYFCNPPYKEPLFSEFLEYGVRQSLGQGVTGLFLVYAHVGTKWWHKYVEEHDFVVPHFNKGRIQFQKFGIAPRRCKDCKISFFQEVSKLCPNCGIRGDLLSAPYDSAWLSIKP